MTVIKVPYKPRRWAQLLHHAAVRWIALIIHRRGGKTTAAFNHLQRDALRQKETRWAYIAPTFKQAKRIVWSMAKFYARGIPGVVFNESELLIKYPNGSEMMIVGSDNPDSLRGIGLWGCFLDEFPQQSPIIFTEIITKCLADHLGYCIFGGTPKGKGHFHKVYKTALKNEKGNWLLVYRTIDDSLRDEAGETIENLRTALRDDKDLVKQGLMTEDEYQQEWYNSFEAAIKGAVYLKQIAEAREKDRITNVPWDPKLPVYTVWDLGIGKSDAMAVGFFQRSGKELWMIDYLETIQLGLPGTIRDVKSRPYVYGKHFAPHDIRHKELGTGKTRLETARTLGIDFEVVPSLGVDDGIDLGRALWQHVWIDKVKCEIFLDFIGQYHYEQDEKKSMFKKVPVHDFTSHAADMWRYAAVVEDEMRSDDFAPVPKSEIATDDDYVGALDPEEENRPDGFGKHPMMRGVDIGRMGHDTKKE